MAIVGRYKIDHPTLGTSGGSALYASIETIYTNISNSLSGRYATFSAIANSGVITVDHNFGVALSEITVMLYSGTFSTFTAITDPVAAGWTIAATSGFATTKIDITAPPSGGTFTGAYFVVHNRNALQLTALLDGQSLFYDTTSGKFLNGYTRWASETATIASNTITPTSARPTKRIIGTASDLQMLASPTADKVVAFINETGSDILIKNDTGATAANRFYTGTGQDFTLKNNAGVLAVYDSGLSRWILIGGGGSGGLTGQLASSSLTAVSNIKYVYDLTSGPYTLTFPSGTTAFVISISDALGLGSAAKYLRVAPPTGQAIDSYPVNDTLDFDYKDFSATFYRIGGSSVIYWADKQLTSTLPPASATVDGYVTTGTQSFGGNKTFGNGASVSLQLDGNGFITGTTSDGADNKFVIVSGGGGGTAWTQNRGAGIIMNGNEVSGAEGEMVYFAGNSGGTFGRHRWVVAGVDVATCSQLKVWRLGDGSLGATTSVLELTKANAVSNRLIAGIDAATRGYVRINAAQTNLEFEAASDRRIKENITPLTDALAKIVALQPCTFNMKDTGNADAGFIAQEYAEVFPSSVTTTDDGLGEDLPENVEPWTMSTGSLPVFLVKAIQEQQAIIEELRERIEILEGGN